MVRINRDIINTLKEQTKQWASRSSFHGIPNISHNSSKIIRFVWVIFLLASGSYCFYGIIKSFQDYFRFEVNTLIRNERVNSLQFPTVTFCNKNPLEPIKTRSCLRTILKWQLTLI